MKCSVLLTAAVSVFVAALDHSPLLSQATSVEYQVKAVYLFNFAKFVDWPRQAFARPDTPFSVCLAGDPFEGALEKTIQGETINGRPLAVRRLSAGENLSGCHMVYVGRSESQSAPAILNAAAKEPILTVGETESFIDNGGMIRFVETGQRIRFEIN